MEKFCGKCNTIKSGSEFHRRGEKHQPWCKLCSLANDRKYYKENQKRREDVRERKERNAKINQEFIISYFKDNPCSDCGESNPIVLEFDHLYDKRILISKMIGSGYSLESLKDEISKCEVVCANCHRIRTARTFNYWKCGIV